MEQFDQKNRERGILYVVATPIGNLGDMTYRAIETLKKVDLIVCEDTRTSRKLLEHYEISTPTMSFYQNVRRGGAVKPIPKLEIIMNEIEGGKNVAFITDAGTPGISDPGNQLVEYATRDKKQEIRDNGQEIDGNKNKIKVVPIPGVSALGAIISVSGIDLTKFVFVGFPPHKKGRETFFKEVVSFEFPVIYYESPHRVIKNMELLKNLAPNKKIILGRELTKMFEEIVRGSVGEVLEYFQNNPGKVKGEFVIIAH